MKATVNERDEVLSIEREKKCHKCKRVLPLTMFGIKSDSKDGLQVMCRECKSTYSKEYEANRKARLKKEAEFLAMKEVLSKGAPSGMNDAVQTFTVDFGNNETTKVILGEDSTAKISSGAVHGAIEGHFSKPVIDNYYDFRPAISREEVQRINATSNIMAAVALLLEMPDKERVAVIGMVQAYNNAMDGIYE